MSGSKDVSNLERRALGRTFARAAFALFTVGSFGALAVFGGQIVVDSGSARATGTGVTVAAPAVSLVCPIPFAAPESSALSEVSGEGDASTKSVSGATATLIGGQGRIEFAGLGFPKDSSSGEQKSAKPVNWEAMAGPNSGTDENSRANTLRKSGFEGALHMTTRERAVSDLEAGEFSAASLISSHSAQDNRGLATASCTAASGEHWLVGGSTAVGSSTKLVIQNPSVTPATVTVTAWGPSGRIELSGSDTYLVPGGTQISTLLEGLAADQRRLALHVEAQGAQVSAYLEHSELDGVTPYGIDYVTDTAAPSRVQVVTGLDLAAVPVDSDDASALRLVVPDFAPATSLAEQSAEDAAEIDADVVGKARIYLLGPDGNVVMFGAQEVELVAGQVQDVSLGGAPEGVYSAVIESDVPVLAGAQLVKRADGGKNSDLLGTPRDFAWVSAVPAFSNATFDSRSALAELDLGHAVISDEVFASTNDSAVALPAGIAVNVSVVSLPRTDSASGVSEALSQIPKVYTALSGSEASEEETESSQEAKAAWKSEQVARVVAYRADGSVALTRALKLATGQSQSVQFAAAQDIAAVLVTAEDGAPIAWSVGATQSDISGSISHLTPVTAVQEPTDMWVARSAQLN